MPFYQLDASALVKRYIEESGTGWIRALVDPTAGNVISIAEISRAEVASALARRAREGSITVDECDELIRDLATHCATEYQLVPTDYLVVDLAIELLQRHRLRAYDAVQLATALIVNRSLVARALFSGPVWVIDPIDGTANYAHGHPYVSISVALAVDGEPCLGVVYAPFLREIYTAIQGAGATCDGCPIRVSGVSELRRALIGTGFPHDCSDVTTAMERVRRLVTACQDIRRAGSPALDIAWVAAGRLDAHCESLAPWDIAAAGLIATEAGALRGNLVPEASSLPPSLRGEEFIVATPGIFEPLCELLRAGSSDDR